MSAGCLASRPFRSRMYAVGGCLCKHASGGSGAHHAGQKCGREVHHFWRHADGVCAWRSVAIFPGFRRLSTGVGGVAPKRKESGEGRLQEDDCLREDVPEKVITCR